MECLYIWKTRPELVRFVATTVLTYIVDVARRYMMGEFDKIVDWRPIVLGIAVGGVQFIGARLLTWLGEQTKTPPPSPATAPPRWGKD